jgi:hypothetical protein
MCGMVSAKPILAQRYQTLVRNEMSLDVGRFPDKSGLIRRAPVGIGCCLSSECQAKSTF